MKVSLKAARVNAGFSQKEIAKKMKKSETTILNWENGNTIINVIDFKKICKILGVKEDDIFFEIKSS